MNLSAPQSLEGSSEDIRLLLVMTKPTLPVEDEKTTTKQPKQIISQKTSTKKFDN